MAAISEEQHMYLRDRQGSAGEHCLPLYEANLFGERGKSTITQATRVNTLKENKFNFKLRLGNMSIL